MRIVHLRRAFFVAFCLSAAQLSVVAEEQTFNFKDPKGVNSISFVLDSELEPIMGVAHGVSGEVKCDPKDMKKLRGKIVVAADSVRTSNELMTQKLHSDEWLDAKANPEIAFELKSVDSVKADPKAKDSQVLEVSGSLTCHGITKDIKVTVTVTHLPGRLKDRLRGSEGDLLVVRSQFTVKRSDFKLGAPMPIVADEMQIRVAIVGQCPKS
ncbi:MAG: YceI family protein [Planctomycetota bacterium]